MWSWATSRPSSRWARSPARRRSYRVRRTIRSSWKARYSSMMRRRDRIFGCFWLSTRASIFTAKLVCSAVWAKRRFNTTWGFASFFSSMTTRIPLRSVSSRRSEMPSRRLSFTCSAMFLMSWRLFTWYGSSVTTMRVRSRPYSSSSCRARRMMRPRPVA